MITEKTLFNAMVSKALDSYIAHILRIAYIKNVILENAIALLFDAMHFMPV